MSKRKRKSARTRSPVRRNVVSGTSRPPQQTTTAALDQPTPKEYEYVSRDLKQVTALAAAIFVLLIALSFFIG